MVRKSSAEDGYHIGFVRLLKKEFDEALKFFDKALNGNDKNPSLYYLKGVSLMKKKRAKGEPLFQKPEIVEGLREEAQLFSEALRRGYKRICPSCGYRTSFAMNFCLRCGMKLLG